MKLHNLQALNNSTGLNHEHDIVKVKNMGQEGIRPQKIKMIPLSLSKKINRKVALGMPTALVNKSPKSWAKKLSTVCPYHVC